MKIIEVEDSLDHDLAVVFDKEQDSE